MRVGIVGAGHAGVEAARAAREAGARVTLFSAESVVPYYRPRLVALAFRQAEFPAIQMHPAEWYSAQGIELRLNARVDALEAVGREWAVGAGGERFDAVVLASGACPVLPPFAAAGGEVVRPLWNTRHAEAIRARVRRGGRLTVVGGGILGIEAALRALEGGMTVDMVELMPRLMPAQFGAHASAVLLRRLTEKGIRVTLGHGVRAVAPIGGDAARLELDDGRAIEADLCLVCIGARPDKALAERAGLKTDRGLVVDAALRTSGDGCYAAGDLVQAQGVTRCSMREATNQGRVAGANAALSAVGSERRVYRPETPTLSLRSGDFEIYSIGQPGGVGYEEHLLEGATERAIRSLILKDGVPMGVQMIGTRQDLDQCAAMIREGRALPARP
jgi:3-phenylpropionate/trans-cinnamate dioxygenase ferredoxin reductase subunit